MNKLNTAVIGCGSWGRNHVRVLKELISSNLVAIADANPDTAKEIGEKYQVKYYSDPYKLLENPDIQFVSICTPTVTHAEIALEAIKQGKHVLVEKPLTSTIKEGKTLLSKAKKKGVFLTVGFIERFNPAVEDAYNRINRGEIVETILAHTVRVSRRPLRIGDVGVIKDLAVHDLDIANKLFNELPETVYASAGSIAHTFEDYANINLIYKKNRSAFIETNWLTPQKVRTLRITGTEAIITVDYITQELTIENNQQIIKPQIPYAEPLYKELEHVTQSIQSDRQPQVTGEDGLKALTLCEAALRSAKTKKPVDPREIK
jgi:UDP-N-acetylglucosamine 3-dehydrogenase